MNLEERIIEFLRRYDLSDLAIAFIVGLLFTNLSLVIHELSHVIVARYLGCPASINSLNIYTGYSSVGECSNDKMVVIALAGPIGAFLYGLFCWYYGGKDSILRLAGLISFFYSVMPSLYPFLPGSDMYAAIRFGFSPALGTIVWLSISAIIYYLVALEIVDRVRIFK